MKKYIIGIIIGFALATVSSANAAVESMIGKVVEGVFPVKVDGQRVEKEAIVIDGTSYLPVRALGDALGMDVGFDADLGITLSNKTQPSAPTNSTKQGGSVMTVPGSQEMNAIDVDKAVKVFDKISIKTDETYSLSSGYAFVEANGDQYVEASALNNRPYSIEWSNPYLTYTWGESRVSVNPLDDYTIHCEGFTGRGGQYVKLSLFGLKARIDGDSLIIDKA